MPRGLVSALRRRIAVKLTLTLVGFVALAVLAAGVYLNHALESFAVEALQARLVTAARLLDDEARALLTQDSAPAAVHAFAARGAERSEARVTLIAVDGRVLGDSDVEPAGLARLENHRERPEVRTALAGSVGRDLRTSASIKTPLIYVAVPVRDAGRVSGVLRLALPLTAVTSSYAALHRVMQAGGLVALAVAFGIGMFVAGRVTRPVVEMQRIAHAMSEGRFDVRAPVRSVDEIGGLGRALNLMTARLREKIGDLEEERAKARAILDGMVEGVIAVDGHEAIVLMNERARAMFGVGAGRGEGKPFLEVIRNAELHEVFRQSRRAPADAPLVRELRLRHPVPRILQINAVPVRLAGGAEPGVVMVLHDLTALRRLEQVRTEFVANVSHELRTPLTAMQGYLETLLGGALEEPQNARRFLEIAFRHTERLGRLLNDLTDLSNIELGKVTLRLAPVRLADVVDSVFEIIRPKAEGGHVGLITDVQPPDLTVHADHDRLAQILINLVDNAVKYTPENGWVTVRARPLDATRAEIRVRDTGIGIPAADLPRITERFYRVDKARSRELGGTGLGLAIVKHLVLAHGGELGIDSQEGEGTTVRFTLPMKPPPPTQLSLPIRSVERAPEPGVEPREEGRA
ncbi:MAG TPA: ATP-binding protein [Methylomirabilota bacterium]|nr:ATP-binding protein [Methylomirabilota bacterium]